SRWSAQIRQGPGGRGAGQSHASVGSLHHRDRFGRRPFRLRADGRVDRRFHPQGGGIMAFWLLKTGPSPYSYSDLERDAKTPWNGITNPTALIHLREMKKGDQAFVYHTGGERAIVGVAEIVTPPYPDPKAKNPKIVIVDIAAKKKLAKPVDLDTIKKD